MRPRTEKAAREKWPMYGHFASMPSTKLSCEEARDADCDTRINSIGRYLAKRAIDFHFSLSSEGRISFDPDDICSELWIELQEKNDCYNWEVATYLAFASTVIRHKLIMIREASRVVKMPENAFVAFAEGERDRDSLSKTRRLTITRMLAAAVDHMPLISDPRMSEATETRIDPPDESADPHEELELEESEEASLRNLAESLKSLTVLESVVLGASMGLWGQEKRTLAQVSYQYGHNPKFWAAALREARRKLGVSAKSM